jgi:hypothetical protein
MGKLANTAFFTAVFAASQAPVIAEPTISTTKAAQAVALGAQTKLSWQGMAFSIQPPKDFDLSVEPGPGGGANFFWHGKKRVDGTTPILTVLPVVRSNDDAKLTTDNFIANWFESGRKKADAMDKTPTSDLKVKGRTFRCANYRRVSRQTI